MGEARRAPRRRSAPSRGAGLGIVWGLVAALAPWAVPPPAGAGAAASLDCATAPIAEPHLREGELNRRGRLVGFHHLGPHRDRIVQVLRGPNAQGVHEAEFRGFGQLKRSTFFPDVWTREEVLAAVREACAAAGPGRGGRLIGRSRSGLRIQMYLDDRGGIATAFPLYEASP